jgi:hypothetical protein
VIEDEKITTEKALHEMGRLIRAGSPEKRPQDATSNYKIYQELQRIEDSDFKQISPFQHHHQMHDPLSSSGYDEKEGLRREDLNSSGPTSGK